ncbi:YkvA family protein [Acetoanaerobium noterae]|uniref:YkvA family protein n=1 Tax=Acetoanaerobium noterae TaxID=745369 RepID=UPI0032424F5C
MFGFKRRASKLKRDIPALILALRIKETPLIAKFLAGIIMVYAFSPIDFIPDFIPILGYLDDLIILPLLISITVKLIPNEIMDNCRMEASTHINKINKRWLYSIPFILIWLVIGWTLLQHM